ncbi:hypothetical protein [Hymenobacter terrestris]|uniref:PH domain-containing protein n=1 Tax=Hymenobacter terrestris TaxID=2748310 RepID=A0ABX2Q990_9BACT|nr:hypothetical protein [Hymenobacter terrestris]NVO86792.1 hypothetical protein [Hymenobacter terrestris]
MPILYQTRLSPLYLGYYAAAAAFFSTWACLLFYAGWVVPARTHERGVLLVALAVALLALFAYMAAISAAKALAAPYLVLTNEAVILHRPLQGQQRRVALTDFTRLSEARYAITSSYRGLRVTIFEGQETTLHGSDGLALSFNSFEIAGYDPFLAHLHQAWQPKRGTRPGLGVQSGEQHWKTYGWIAFMLLFAFGLLYILFMK